MDLWATKERINEHSTMLNMFREELVGGKLVIFFLLFFI